MLETHRFRAPENAAGVAGRDGAVRSRREGGIPRIFAAANRRFPVSLHYAPSSTGTDRTDVPIPIMSLHYASPAVRANASLQGRPLTTYCAENRAVLSLGTADAPDIRDHRTKISRVIDSLTLKAGASRQRPSPSRRRRMIIVECCRLSPASEGDGHGKLLMGDYRVLSPAAKHSRRPRDADA